MYIKSSGMVCNANSSYFLDGGYSYLTQYLPEVCIDDNKLFGFQVWVEGQGQIIKLWLYGS